MSLLSIISSVCLRSGITDAPTTVIGNTDPTIAQLLELLREEVEELFARHEWARLQKEVNYLTVAADLQGDLATIAPDFDRFIDDTDWNRSFTSPINSPITPATWQFLKARMAASPYYGMRIKQNPATYNNAIYLIPTPPAGQSVYFEYVSNLVWKPTVGAPIADCAADTNVCMLPEKLLKAGLRWRWKKEKGLSYAEDFQTYERNVAVTWAQDGGGAPTVSIDNCNDGNPHYIDNTNVPDGNW